MLLPRRRTNIVFVPMINVNPSFSFGLCIPLVVRLLHLYSMHCYVLILIQNI